MARYTPTIALVLAIGAAACSSGSSATSASRRRPPAESSVATSTSAPPVQTTTARSCAPTTSSPVGQGAQGKEINPPGDIPDNQAFVAYTPPGGEYTVKVPEGWGRTEAAGSVSFTDKFNTVKVELLTAAPTPSVERAQADEAPRLATTMACFQAGKVTAVTRKAGTAILITYRADSPPDPVTGKVVRNDVERYEFWHNGTEAVITLSGAAGSDNVDPWRLITDSFAWR